MYAYFGYVDVHGRIRVHSPSRVYIALGRVIGGGGGAIIEKGWGSSLRKLFPH